MPTISDPLQSHICGEHSGLSFPHMFLGPWKKVVPTHGSCTWLYLFIAQGTLLLPVNYWTMMIGHTLIKLYETLCWTGSIPYDGRRWHRKFTTLPISYTSPKWWKELGTATRYMATLYPKRTWVTQGSHFPKNGYYEDNFMNVSGDSFMNGSDSSRPTQVSSHQLEYHTWLISATAPYLH